MHVLETIKKLEKSLEFSSWKKTHDKAYLAHAFMMIDKANEDIWQIGYYDPKINLIGVFVVSDVITKNEDTEVFKEEKKLVNPLETEDVKINEDEALEKAKKIVSDNYKGSTVFKTFMILQNIDKIGQVWNITFVTDQFQTINVKINSKNGECEGHKLVSLIQGREK